MSTKAQVQTQAKTPAAPGPTHFRQPPVSVPEREADRPDIATQLEGAARLGHSLGAVRVDSSLSPIIQRQDLPEEEEEELQMKREPTPIQRQELLEDEKEEALQTKPANGVQRQGRGEGFRLDDETAGRINRARGGGQPLDGALQRRMGETMGHHFSGVRVHTDSEADDLNQQLSAKAFTTGQDIFFRRGEYNPGSSRSRELIAHELSHVVQQSTGQVKGGDSGMFVRPTGDVFEQDAAGPAREPIVGMLGVALRRQGNANGVVQRNNGGRPRSLSVGDLPHPAVPLHGVTPYTNPRNASRLNAILRARRLPDEADPEPRSLYLSLLQEMERGGGPAVVYRGLTIPQDVVRPNEFGFMSTSASNPYPGNCLLILFVSGVRRSRIEAFSHFGSSIVEELTGALNENEVLVEPRTRLSISGQEVVQDGLTTYAGELLLESDPVVNTWLQKTAGIQSRRLVRATVQRM